MYIRVNYPRWIWLWSNVSQFSCKHVVSPYPRCSDRLSPAKSSSKCLVLLALRVRSRLTQMACWRCTRTAAGASAWTAAPTTRRCGGATPRATTCATRAGSTRASTAWTARSSSPPSGWWVCPHAHYYPLSLCTGADAELLTRFYKDGSVQRWMSVEGMTRGMKKVSRWRVD